MSWKPPRARAYLLYLFFHQTTSLPQLVGLFRGVEDGPVVLLFYPLVPEHLVVHPHVLALHGKGSLGCLRINHEVVVAVGAVFVAFLELLGVFSEALLALLASKHHLEGLLELMRLLFVVALGAVEPLLACFITS